MSDLIEFNPSVPETYTPRYFLDDLIADLEDLRRRHGGTVPVKGTVMGADGYTIDLHCWGEHDGDHDGDFDGDGEIDGPGAVE